MFIPPRLPRRRLRLILLCLSLVLFALGWRRYVQVAELSAAESHSDAPASKGSDSVGSGTSKEQCLPHLNRLKGPPVDLSEVITYSRRCVRPTWGPGHNRVGPTKVPGPLMRDEVIVNLTSCKPTDFPCESLSLHVSYPHARRRYPHLLFGVATTYDRLRHALPGFAHWLSGSGSRLVAVVADAHLSRSPAEDLRTLESLYRDHSIHLSAVAPRNSSLTVAQNHFTILVDLLDAATSQTHWLALVDDDTFFPSLHNLDEELAKHNHKGPTWLGALSENLDSVKRWGYMAYGGAGVFISAALARQLVPHIPRCLAEATLPTGDVILRDCIHEHTATKLTIVPGLYQHDLYGDASGFYESGVQPLSVHHWRNWYKAPLPEMAAITSLCGDCFLQRWQFGSDTLLANGYSISKYRRNLDHYDLTQMEATWMLPGHDFDSSLGPLRPALDEDEKKSYRLKDSLIEANGDIIQIYVYKGDFFADERDEVLELVWQAGNRR